MPSDPLDRGDASQPPDVGEPTRGSLRRLDAGRYVSFRTVGEGGMGVVYSALDTELNRVVAFKLIRPRGAGEGTTDPGTGPLEVRLPAAGTPGSEGFAESKARFLQEAWITAGLEHPGIVPIHEIGETPGAIPYYTMRFVPGLRTLDRAIADLAGRTVEDRLALVEPFLRLCDTVAFAHSRAVIHRDIKPANVALGDFGEVVLLDWGIAKVERGPEAVESGWQARLAEQRRASDLQTMASALGTPGYMSPEAALGETDDVDALSDVYSLGVVLFEILTGRLPFPFTTFLDYATRVTTEDAPRARAIDPAVPEALDDLCVRCLLRERSARPPDVVTLARSIRAWQTASATQREVEGHLRDARTALDAARSLTGVDRLREADRAAAALALVTTQQADHAEAKSLAVALADIREQGHSERATASRRRLLVRGGIAALAVSLVAAALVAKALDVKREEAETARTEAVEAKAEVQTALDEVLRLADSKHARDLVLKADELWPATPDKATAMAAWIERARAVIARRAEHQGSLARLRGRAIQEGGAGGGDSVEVSKPRTYRFAAPADEWRQQVLLDLLADLDRLVDPAEASKGVLADLVRREAFASTLLQASVGDHAAEWKTTIEAIAESPKYGGLRIEAQVGLVPLGPDPESGLFEFAHLGSGPLPARDGTTGRLVLPNAGFSFVLVLLPGGTYEKGAQKKDPETPNYDPEAEPAEGPVWPVTLSPYFLSKYECTQAQWMEMTGGENPSSYPPGQVFGGKTVTQRNPVDQVSWLDCAKWLPRFGLTLPSEAQWEYACRGGTDTPWPTGDRRSSLQGAANVADLYAKQHGAPATWLFSEDIDDGHFVHAPVGSFTPNRFGFYDMIGNICEWCQDSRTVWTAQPPKDPLAEGPGDRIARGGSWLDRPTRVRSAARTAASAGAYLNVLGFRPARRLTTR